MRNFKKWIGLFLIIMMSAAVMGAGYRSSDNNSLNEVYNQINQQGFTLDTLSKLSQIENEINTGGDSITLSDVNLCYNAYTNNLIALNRDKEVPDILKRWNESLEKVYTSKKVINEAFGYELAFDSNTFFYACILAGTSCDQLLIDHTSKLADYIYQKTKIEKTLPKALYQSALESKAYALLYNKKYVDFGSTVAQMENVKDQLTGKLPGDIMPVHAYKNMLDGNNAKCDVVIKNFCDLMGKSQFKEVNPIRTGYNVLIDDVYQMKKRNIGGSHLAQILKNLPKPGIKITGVAPGGLADKAGIKTGDMLVGYNNVDVLSYYHLMDLIDKYRSSSKIIVAVMRNGKKVIMVTKGGRLGIGLEESYLKR